MMKKTVIVDIDGTVALMHPERKAILDVKPVNWEKFYKASFDDEPLENMVSLVNNLGKTHIIVFCTARSYRCMNQTVAWIEKYFNISYSLIMRGDSDERESKVVKLELINKHLFTDEIAYVLEDELEIVEAFEKAGLPVIHVKDGEVNYESVGGSAFCAGAGSI